MADDLTLLKDRIIDFGRKPADQFQANPLNWRKHPQRQRDAVEASLRELGWVGVAIENVQTGNLIDGHERVWQALKADNAEVPFIQVDLSPEEEALALATFDAITSMAETDAAKLDALLKDVSTNEAALQALMAETAAAAGLYPDKLDDGDAEPQVDRADELRQQWGVETGQLWRLPSRTPGQEHRLICGDCTDAEVVGRLSPHFDMMFTDPPYGVDYEGGHFHSGDVNIVRKREKLASDTNADIYAQFLPAVMPLIDGPCYVWFASTVGKPVFDAIIDNGGEIHAMLIWNKTNATYAAMNAQYKQRHEPFMYFKRRGQTLMWCGATTEATVWDLPRDAVNTFHPTQKPVSLAERAIGNHTAQTVADFFLGSGTTLIAAENLARQCRAVEISPGYVAVALQRYQDAFGITAELVE